jgi:uncharacterized membrane protein
VILGPVQFDEAGWLLLAPVAAALVWWFGRVSLSGLGSATRRLAIGVRLVVVLLLVAALADPHVRDEHDAVVNIVVIDESESMGPEATARMRQYLAEVLRGAEAGDERVALVTAAKDALAQLLPTPSSPPRQTVEQFFETKGLEAGDREGTNLADAILLAVAMKPDDAAARITLVSDGNETEGSALAAARSAQAAGVPIDVLPAERERQDDVIFADLVAPNTGRKGQTVAVHAMVEASRRTRGELELLLDGRPIDLSPDDPSTNAARVTLDSGPNRLSYPVTLPRGGPLTFESRFMPVSRSDDALVQNNRQLATTFATSEGRVLMLTNSPEAAEPLRVTMAARDIDADVVSPAYMPGSLIELQLYDAVIMFDVPQADFSTRQQRDLAAYVHESGGGLIKIGGPDSFGAGGWINTPIADILPVRLDPPAKRQMPRGALAIVIDNSGSMASAVGNSGLSQLEIAKEGALAAISTLTREDLVSVIRFDSSAELMIRATPAREKGRIASAVRRITSGGGTNMQPGLRLAIEQLADARAGVRHVVVLSDGQTTGDANAFSRLIDRANDNDITVSTITIGDFSNDPLMERIASSTGGNYHPVSIQNNGVARLPEIFIKEAQLVRRSLIWEGEPVQPRVVNAGVPTMAGITALPPVTGYVVTADRGGVSMITSTVRTDPDVADPFTAQWQHGLGRVVAFTSDATARWSEAWLSWGGFQAYWEQHIRWAMRASGSANVSIATRNDGDTTRVIVTALDDAGEPVNFGRVQGRVAQEGGTEQRSAAPLALTQTGPGRYEGSFESGDPGHYLVTLTYAARSVSGGEELERGFANAAVVRPFADEFRVRQTNRALLEKIAQETGGRVLSGDSSSDELFARVGLERPVALSAVWLPVTLAAIGLFLADVGIRRVRLSPAAVAAWVGRAFGDGTRETAHGAGALRMARARARDRFTPALKGAAADQRSAAKTKFEASPEELAAAPRSPVDAPKQHAGSADRRAAGQRSGDDDHEEEAGMGRLLAAKRRAAEQHAEEDEAAYPGVSRR